MSWKWTQSWLQLDVHLSPRSGNLVHIEFEKFLSRMSIFAQFSKPEGIFVSILELTTSKQANCSDCTDCAEYAVH